MQIPSNVDNNPSQGLQLNDKGPNPEKSYGQYAKKIVKVTALMGTALLGILGVEDLFKKKIIFSK